MGEAAAALSRLGTEARTEVTRRRWVSGSIQVAVFTASLNADYRRWDEWAARCAGAHQMIASVQREQHRRGWPYQPFFRARASILNVLADGKWKAPPEFRDLVLPMAGHAAEYAELEDEFWAGSPDEPGEADLRTMELLSWAGLHLFKCHLRFRVDSTALVLRLQQRHSFLLEDRKSPLYWDREIFELWLAGRLTEDSYNRAAGNRLAALRKQLGPGQSLDSYVAATLDERRIYGLAGRRMEVV